MDSLRLSPGCSQLGSRRGNCQRDPEIVRIAGKHVAGIDTGRDWNPAATIGKTTPGVFTWHGEDKIHMPHDLGDEGGKGQA